MKNKIEYALGEIVKSCAGRDNDNIYMVIKLINHNFVEVVDGDKRKQTNPKKKRIKHLTKTHMSCETIAAKLKEKKKVYDSEIYSALKNSESNEATK